MGIEFSKRAVIRVIMDAMAGLDSLKDIYDKVEAMEEPTQPELVEVPDVEQFIADWYEEHKGDLEQAIFDLHVDLYLKSHYERTEFEEWAACGDVRPTETLIRMKDGYTVKKEQLYYVEFGFDRFLVKGNAKFSDETDFIWIEELENIEQQEIKLQRHFTEKEIKAIDERYWAFAVPVEEEE